MDARERIDAALKDLAPAEEEMLDAFFTFANKHLTQAIHTVNEINAMLEDIHKDLTQ